MAILFMMDQPRFKPGVLSPKPFARKVVFLTDFVKKYAPAEKHGNVIWDGNLNNFDKR